MATFTHMAPPVHQPPRHLGKRLLGERERLGIPLDVAAYALQTDHHTLTAIEAGDAIPPRLSAPLRRLLQDLQAMPTPIAQTESPLPLGEGQGEGLSVVADETVTDLRDDDPPAPAPAPAPSPQPSALGPHPSGLTDWDAGHLYTEVNARRRALGLTWLQAAEQIGLSDVSLRHLPQASYLKAATRAKLVAWLDSPRPDAPPSNATPQEPPAMLDSNSSAILRSQMIRAMLDRKLTQHQLAQQIGLRSGVVQNIIKSPTALLPQDLAERITTWLNEETTNEDTPITGHLRETLNQPSDSPFIVHRSSLPSEASMLTPVPTHPDIFADTVEPLANDPTPVPDPDVEPLSIPSSVSDESTASDAPSLDPGPPPQAPVDDDPRPDPRLMRLFTNINLHLPPPSGRDVALLALLDKFPEYDAMHSAGEQSQWFRWFDSFARLALVSSAPRPTDNAEA